MALLVCLPEVAFYGWAVVGDWQLAYEGVQLGDGLFAAGGLHVQHVPTGVVDDC